MKDFCLKDEIVLDLAKGKWLEVRFVKEFIKILKEDWACTDTMASLIDKRAGDLE